MIALDSDLFDYAEENEQAQVGYFSWTRQEKMALEVINNGDELILAQWFGMGNREQVQNIVLEGAEAYVAAHQLEGIQTLAIRDPESDAVLSVRTVFALASGEHEGRKIRKAYDKFRNDYGKKLYEEMTKLIEGTSEGLGDAKEGFFEFVLGEDVGVEVTNTGNELMFAVWWNLPDEVTEKQKASVVQKANKEVGGKKLKHFGPATVEMYPGYDLVLRAAVRTPIDGSVTNKQIREAFDHFSEEFCHEIYKKV